MSKDQKSLSVFRSNLEEWMGLSTGIFIVYGGILLIGALVKSIEMSKAITTILAGVPIIVTVWILFLFFPRFKGVPILVGMFTAIIFMSVGAYLKYLDFYFFVMLLIVGTIATVKDFKLMLNFVLILTLYNILVLLFIAPRLEWLDTFHFFIQFILSLYGSVFMLLQTYNVVQKEGRSERALTAFVSLLRCTPNLMVITDAKTRVLYLSDQMAKFIEYKSKEYAIGQPLIDLVADHELKFMFASILDAKGFYETIMELKLEGENRHFKIVKDNLTGDIAGAFIDITDITNTVLSEQAAMKANKSKSDFLAAMSHEIRTPMNAIMGIAQIHSQKNDITDDCKIALNKIYNSSNILLKIINDILDLSKIETGKMDLYPLEYDLPSLIQDTAQLNIVRIGSKPINFVMELDENLPSRLIGDELRIKQILNNLLSNAIKYTDKGQVKLKVEIAPANDELQDTCNKLQDNSITPSSPPHSTSYMREAVPTPNSELRTPNFNIRFIVSDTGQGMKPKDRDRLFSEYLRFNIETNRTVEGTGIGLMIVKNLVKMMEGSIEVESEFGVGSTFIVSIKQKAVECDAIGFELAKQLCSFNFSSERQETMVQIERVSMPYGKVLIVDDVETNLYVAEGLMALYDLQIETAINGYLAINKIESGNIYDVIFMDHMMPMMDGIETTHKIRDLGYKGIIVALTANAIVGNKELFIKEGFDDFISKPIDVKALDDILRKYVLDKSNDELQDTSYKMPPPTPPINVGGKTPPINIGGKTPPTFMGGAGGGKLLEIMRRDIENSINTLKDTIASEDTKLFTTTVHGLKSILAQKGEIILAEKASKLENAGLGDDMAYILAHADSFIQSLVDLLNSSAFNIEVKSDDFEIIQEDTDFLFEQLQKIKQAALDYDDTAIYAALDLLNEKSWTKKTIDELEKIRESIFLHSDFEVVVDLVERMER